MKKNFLSCLDRKPSELLKILNKALEIKRGKLEPNFSGKVLTLLFANPSLRTRLSFANGFQKFGGTVSVLDAADAWNFEFNEGVKMNGNTQEHYREMIKVISRYSDLIGIRDASLATKDSQSKKTATWEEVKKNDHLIKFGAQATVPVINMESNIYHPCQALADAMTIMENTEKKKEDIRVVLTWAPHPKALPLATPHSQLLLPALLGMKIDLCCPPKFELDAEVMQTVKKSHPEFKVHHDQGCLSRADFVITKSWASLAYFSQWKEEKKYREKFSDWTLDLDKIGSAKFMHCLPIRRNIVATDSLLDSEQSLVIDEAENRMWAQVALMEEILS